MPRRALSLKAYLAYARGGRSGEAATAPLRPDGPVVLLVSDGALDANALFGLGARLRQHRPDLWVLRAGDDLQGADVVTLPPERTADCDAFAKGLRASVVIWAGTRLRPALLDALKTNGARLIAINQTAVAAATPAPRWMPDPTYAALSLFDRLYVDRAEAQRVLRRQGFDRTQISVSGVLHDTQPPLDCDPALHEEMAALIVGRPVWVASRLHVAEAEPIMRAQRQATRLAHRLLLLAVPATPDAAHALAAAASDMQLRACYWEDGGMPDENTQVLIAESTQELGLWYRLAPLAFMGQSLVPNAGGCNPFEASALGAAILYGPNVGAHLAGYSRLVEAGAARIVRDPDSLAAAVSHLIAPDQAAAMAHSGWEVIANGAELADDVIAQICATLDGKDLV